MPKPKSFPKAVEQGVVRDFAKGNGKPHTLEAICADWMITESEAKSIRNRFRAQINEQRQALSIACFELASHAAGEMVKDLCNPEKMAETPFRDKAQALEKLVNAGVTAADGHKPVVALNFGDIRAGRDMLAERDRRTKELRKAQTAEVV